MSQGRPLAPWWARLMLGAGISFAAGKLALLRPLPGSDLLILALGALGVGVVAALGRPNFQARRAIALAGALGIPAVAVCALSWPRPFEYGALPFYAAAFVGGSVSAGLELGEAPGRERAAGAVLGGFAALIGLVAVGVSTKLILFLALSSSGAAPVVADVDVALALLGFALVIALDFARMLARRLRSR